MKQRGQSGSVLLEGLISILIFSAGILAIVGLQAASMKSTTEAKTRIDASWVASQRIGQIWVDQANLPNYAEADTSISTLPNGKRTTEVAGNQITVTVTWQMPGDAATNSYKTVAQITSNP